MGAPLSTFQQKVTWMKQHHSLWEGWPNARFTDQQITRYMQRDGLISSKSHNFDIMDFGKLIAEARSQMRRNK